MVTTVAGTDRKLQASTVNCTQAEMPFLGVVRPMDRLPPKLVSRASFSGCLIDAARHSGLDDGVIATKVHMSSGYMSRFLRGIGQQWARRLVLFMSVTHSLAPLQWIADQVGCEVVPRDSRAAEVAALQARLRELGEGRAA